MSTTVQPFIGLYDLDRSHSSFQFAVTHLKVSTFRASFTDIDARLVIESDTITLEAQARVESVSITDPQEFRDHVVWGADFFAANEHPVLTFSSESVELTDEGGATVSGELTIRGVTHSVTAQGTFRSPGGGSLRDAARRPRAANDHRSPRAGGWTGRRRFRAAARLLAGRSRSPSSSS